MVKRKVNKQMAYAVRSAIFALLLLCNHAFAQSGPTKLNISGGLFLPSGAPVTNNAVNFRIEILDKDALCVLYSESHLSQDLSASKGGFALQIGSGTSIANNIDGTSSTALSARVFTNPGAVAPFTGCASGLTLNAGDERVVRVYYDLGGGYQAMSPDVPITSSAYAIVAESLQGKSASEFAQLRDDATYDLNQTNLETIFSAVNFAKLVQILSGNFGGTTVTNVGTPSAGTDATNKNYVDANIGGKIADVTAVGPAAGNGHTLIWDQALNRWVTGVPSATDNTKLPLAGGTMTGAIAMGAQNITNIGHMTMAAQRTLNLGTYTNAQETTLIAGLGAADKGKIWFNSDANLFKVWDGSAAVSGFAPTGAAGGDLTGTYPNPTLASGVVATAELANDAVTSAKINNTGIAVNRLLITDATTGANVTYKTCALNETLRWTATGWDCVTAAGLIGNSGVTAATYGNATQVSQVAVDAQGRITLASNVNIAFPVVSVAGKTGAVTLNTADISGLGTAAVKDFGTAAGNLVELDGTGRIPAALLPTSAGDIQDVVAGSGLTGGGASGTVTLSVDTGTTAGKIVQLDASAHLPAVDGRNLSNINAVQLQARNVAATPPTAAQVLTWNASASAWEPQTLPAGNTGDVTSVSAGLGLTGGAASGDATLSVDVGTTANKIVQLDASAYLPAVDGRNLSNINAVQLQTRNVSSAAPTASQVLAWNAANSSWEPKTEADAFTGTVTSVVSGSGLLGGNITSTGTLSIDVGTTAGKIVQLDASAYLPAVDGRNLSNINAVQLQTRNVAATAPTAAQVLTWNASASAWEPQTLPAGNTGDVTSVSAGLGLTGGAASGDATLSVDVGTTANKIVQLDASAYLPAVDGRNLTNVNAVQLQTRNVSAAAPTASQVLAWNAANSTWEPKTESDAFVGTVTSVVGGAGLLGGNITSTGTLAIDVGTTAGKIVQLDASAHLPAVDGRNLSNINAVQLQTRNVAAIAPTAAQVLTWNASASAWEPQTLPAGNVGDVTSVSAGLGLTGGAASGDATLSVDVGTTTGKIVQMAASDKLPAVDGSNLTGLTAAQISGAFADGGNTFSADATLGTNSNHALNFEANSATAMTILPNGNVGIANTNPNFKLTVNGNVSATDYSASWGNATFPSYTIGGQSGIFQPATHTLGVTTSGVERMRIDANGYVGIGTSPVDMLTVSRPAAVNDSTRIAISSSGTLGNQQAALNLVTLENGSIMGASAGNKGWQVFGRGNAFSTAAQQNDFGIAYWSGGGWSTPLQIDSATGFTSLGTGNAPSRLTVEGSMALDQLGADPAGFAGYGTLFVRGDGKLYYRDGVGTIKDLSATGTGSVTSVVGGTGLTGGNITTTGTLAVDTGTTAGKIVQLDASAHLPAVDGRNLTNVNAVQLQTRNVASTAPTAAQVLGWNAANSQWEPQTISVATGGGYINGGNSFGGAASLGTTDNFAMSFMANGSTAMTILPSGNVGVGTASPNYPLEATGYIGSRAADPRFISYDNSNLRTSPNMTGGLMMYDQTPALAGYLYFETGDSNTDLYLGVNTGAGNGGLRLQTAGADRMYVNSTGNVGIGTTSPNTKLEVAGALRLSTTDADTFTTPLGTNIATKINVPYYNPGAFGQVMAMGVPSTANSTSRVITVVDGRTVAHQPSIAVLSPDEAQYVGFTWDGSNTVARIVSSEDLQLQGDGFGAITISDNYVSANKIALGDTLVDNNSFININTSSRVANGIGIHVTGALGADGRSSVLIDTQETGNARYPLRVTANTGATEVLAATGAGNVGVGTNAPNARLTVEGAMTLDQLGADFAGAAGYGSLYTKTDGKLYYRDGTGSIKDLSATGTGSVTSVVGGTGLTGGNITGAGTLAVNVGLAANQIPQLNSNAQTELGWGTAAQPTYSFNGILGTGMSMPSMNVLTFSTNASERLRVDATGNVGVGTTAPVAKVTVSANAAALPAFGGTGDKLLHLGAADNNAARLLLDVYGSGAGVAPVMTFRAARGTAAAPTATQSGDVLGQSAFFGYGATGYSATTRATVRAEASENWTDTAQGTTLKFQTTPNGTTGTANAMTIDPSGRVGIGATAPTAYLQLPAGTAAANTAPLKFVSGTNLTAVENGAMEFDGTNLYFSTGGNRRIVGLKNQDGDLLGVGDILGTDAISIITGGTNQPLTLTSTGTTGPININAGTSSGSINLNTGTTGVVNVNSAVASTSTTTGALVVDGGVGVAGAMNVGSSITVPTVYGSSAASGSLTLDSTSNGTKGYVNINPTGGFVGIGTSTPVSKLEVSGTTTLTSSTNPLFIQNPDSNDAYAGASMVTIRNSGTSILNKYIDFISDYDGDGGGALNFGALTLGANNSFSLYNPSSGPLALQAAGGSVGIGVTNPNALLEIAGVPMAGRTNVFEISRSDGTELFSIEYDHAAGSPYETHFRANTKNFIFANQASATDVSMAILTNGQVGIGTKTPAANATLEVFSTGNGSVKTGLGTPVHGVMIDTSYGAAWAREFSFANGGTKIGSMGISATASTPNFMYFNANQAGATSGHPTAQMALTASGHVGIGTTAPDVRFRTEISTTDGVSGSGIGGSYPIAKIINAGTGPVYRGLEIGAPTGSITSPVYLKVTGTSSRFAIVDQADTENFTVLDSGNVGVGISNPADKLHVAGDARVGTGTTGCLKDADGTVIAGTCSSDVRFKTDVEPLGSRLEQVSQLRPVTYKWRAEEFPDKHFGHETETGLIAQEVQQAIPELVAEDEEGFLKVRFSELNIYILQAVKDLYNRLLGIESHQITQDRQIASKADKAEIEELKARNKKLEQDNAEMKARLDKIEKMLKSK